MPKEANYQYLDATIRAALDKCATVLIITTREAGYINPLLEMTIDVEGGRKFKLTFERVDLD